MEKLSLKEIRANAKAALKNQWGISIAIIIVSSLLIGFGQFIINLVGMASSLLFHASEHPVLAQLGGTSTTGAFLFSFSLVITTGVSWAFLDLADGKKVKLEDIFAGFKNFWKVVGVNLLMAVFTFLWTLLLIIPGFIKIYSYSQTLFILKEQPEIKVMEAITKSKLMMKGNKMRLFLLNLSFAIWYIPAGIILGIAFYKLSTQFDFLNAIGLAFGALIYALGISIYLKPYMATAAGSFYRQVLKEMENKI
ncbi:MAG: DUF975 family protein [Streptococcaceae bacterium]|jgi:uncharacterized membrane protein|nr:DUF975 family protein [Streptococcaceae bacterium]